MSKEVHYKYYVHEVDQFQPPRPDGSVNPLFYAAADGNLEKCRELIDNGCDVNEACRLGQDHIECVPTGIQDTIEANRYGPPFNRAFGKLPEYKEVESMVCTGAGNTDLNGSYKPGGYTEGASMYFNENRAKLSRSDYNCQGVKGPGWWWWDSSGTCIAHGPTEEKTPTAVTSWQDSGIHGGKLAGDLPSLTKIVAKEPTGGVVFCPSCADCVEGWRPLHFAAGNGHADVVALLLKAGADVNATTRGFEWTALHVAAPRAEKGHLECVQILLENEADANKKCIMNATAADYVEIWSWRFSNFWRTTKWCLIRGNEHHKFVEHDDWGRNHDASKMRCIYNDLQYVIDSEYYVAILDVLFKHGCDPNNVSSWLFDRQSASGSTALHRQAARNQELAEPICASPFVRLGFEPRKSLEIIDSYVRNGADTNIKDSEGRIALELAEDKFTPLKDLLSQGVVGLETEEKLTVEELEAGDLTIYIKMSTDKSFMGYVMGDILTVNAFKTDTVAKLKQKIKHAMPVPVQGSIMFRIIDLPGDPLNSGQNIQEGTKRVLSGTSTLEDLKMLHNSMFTVMLPHDAWKKYYLSTAIPFCPDTPLQIIGGKRGQLLTVEKYLADTQEYVMKTTSKTIIDDFFTGGIGYIRLGAWAIGSIDGDHFGFFHSSRTDRIVAIHKTDGVLPLSKKEKLRQLRIHPFGGRKGHNPRHPNPSSVQIGDGFLAFEDCWRLGVINECLSLTHFEKGPVYVWKSTGEVITVGSETGDGTIITIGCDALMKYNLWTKDLFEESSHFGVAVGELYKYDFFGTKGCPRFLQFGDNWRLGDADSQELNRVGINSQDHFVINHTGTKKMNWVLDMSMNISLADDSNAHQATQTPMGSSNPKLCSFLVTEGGNAELNGMYTPQGTHEGKQMWVTTEGARLEWWSASSKGPAWWWLDNSGKYICGAPNTAGEYPPNTGWEDYSGNLVLPVPALSLQSEATQTSMGSSSTNLCIFWVTEGGNTALNGMYKPQGTHKGKQMWVSTEGARLEWWNASSKGPAWWWVDNSGKYICGAPNTVGEYPPNTGWEDYSGNLVLPVPALSLQREPQRTNMYDYLSLADFALATRPDSTLIVHASDLKFEGYYGAVTYREFCHLGEYVVMAINQTIRGGQDTPLEIAMCMPGFDINTQIERCVEDDVEYPTIYGHRIWLLDYEVPLYNSRNQDFVFGCGRLEIGYGDTLLHIIVRNCLNKLSQTRHITQIAHLKPDLTIKNAGGFTAAQLIAWHSKDPSKTQYAAPPSWFDCLGGLPEDCGLPEGAVPGSGRGPYWAEGTHAWHSMPQERDDNVGATTEGAVAPEVCKYALFGLSPLEIVNPSESSRSYSSSRGEEFDKSMLDSDSAWFLSKSEAFAGGHSRGWLQIDLGELQSVGGVVVQGCRGETSWISGFTVEYSEDGSAWEGVPGDWRGCVGDMKGKRVFKHRVKARYLKFVVHEFDGGWGGMRAGVLVSLAATKEIKNQLIQNTFADWDKNHDQIINALELTEALTSLGLSRHHVDALLAEAPGHEDGKVNYDEFLSWINASPGKEPKPVKLMDKIDFIQHSGYISAGGDLLTANMTLDEAKAKAVMLPGCKGFTAAGPASTQMKTYYFKSKWDCHEGSWTSYKMDQ